MSLIICSSTQDEYLRKDRSGNVIATNNGLSNPATFSNNFRSPLIIPKDAEVAVESVKINRAPLFDIPDEALFYFYFGPELSLTTTANDTTKIPVPIRLPRGSYTVDSLKDVLTNTLNKSSLGPEIFGGILADTERNSSLEFSNFTFDVQRQTTKSAIDWSAASSGSVAEQMRPANDVTTTDNFTWDKTAATLTCDEISDISEFSCTTQMPQYPLASVSGVFEVDFSDVTDSWTIGLSRMRIAGLNEGDPINTSVLNYPVDNVAPEPLFDYTVTYDAVADELKVFHALPDDFTTPDGREGKLSNVEVQYYNNTNASFTEPINAAKIAAEVFETIRFTLIGNALNLDIQGKGNYLPIVSSTNASLNTVDKRYNFKPTANTTESLFPSFQLFKATDFLTIDSYEGRDLTNWRVTTTGEDFVAGSDFYSSHIKSGKGLIHYIDNKKSVRPYTATNASFQYTQLNGSDAINYNVVLIGGPERDLSTTNTNKSDTATYVLPNTRQIANMGQSLGFGDYSVLQQSIFKDASSTLGLTIMKPPSQSTLYVNECFIRANNLTGTSYNGAKNSISRILYSLPRFDNAGNTQGNLYFQSSEKTYIKLNNTHEITLNQIDIDLVDRSERIVRDLQGNTIVILYVRKSRN